MDLEMQVVKTDMENRRQGESSFEKPKDNDTDFPEIFERELERRSHDN